MGAFSAFLRDLFQNFLTAIFAREVSRYAALTAAFTALLGLLAALVVGLFLAIQTALQAIVYNIQTPELQTFIGVFWPPHYSLCLSTIISAKLTRWVYDRTTFAAELYWSALSR